MKGFVARIFVGAAVALTALTAVTVSLAAGESGPKCADLTSANTNYRQNADGTYTLGVEFLLGPTENIPACKQITYTLTIDGVGSSPIVVSQQGNAQFVRTFSDTDNQACISGTTASSGGHVHDRGPDTGCVAIAAGPVGGKVGMG